MRQTTLVACLGLLIAAQSEAWAQEADGVVPIGFSISDANKHLFRINMNTGAATDMGIVNHPDDDEIEGIFRRGGDLFGVGEANYDTGGLYNISTNVRVGGSRKLGTEAGAALDPTTGTVYNLQADDLLPEDTARSFLYTINPNNGKATFIGFDNKYADGLAIDGSGRAFATDFRLDCALYRVNLSTGRLTRVGSLGLTPANCTGFDSGAAFHLSDGVLFALREDGVIYRVNTTTGAATFVATVREGGVRVPGDLEGLEVR